jgi:hypothetical protein
MDAEGAMKLFAPGRVGATPSTETIRVEGTNRSEYFATSILAPMLSSAALFMCENFREKHNSYTCENWWKSSTWTSPGEVFNVRLNLQEWAIQKIGGKFVLLTQRVWLLQMLPQQFWLLRTT